jgi:hypothetical protein
MDKINAIIESLDGFIWRWPVRFGTTTRKSTRKIYNNIMYKQPICLLDADKYRAAGMAFQYRWP